MAGCGPQVFQDIGLTTMTCLAAKGATAGMPMNGNIGQATTMGVTVKWEYDEASSTLIVECTDAPFFVPCATVNGRIKDLIEGCRVRSA